MRDRHCFAFLPVSTRGRPRGRRRCASANFAVGGDEGLREAHGSAGLHEGRIDLDPPPGFATARKSTVRSAVSRRGAPTCMAQDRPIALSARVVMRPHGPSHANSGDAERRPRPMTMARSVRRESAPWVGDRRFPEVPFEPAGTSKLHAPASSFLYRPVYIFFLRHKPTGHRVRTWPPSPRRRRRNSPAARLCGDRPGRDHRGERLRKVRSYPLFPAEAMRSRPQRWPMQGSGSAARCRPSPRTAETLGRWCAYGALLVGWMAQSGFRDGCPITTTLLEMKRPARPIAGGT